MERRCTEAKVSRGEVDYLADRIPLVDRIDAA